MFDRKLFKEKTSGYPILEGTPPKSNTTPNLMNSDKDSEETSSEKNGSSTREIPTSPSSDKRPTVKNDPVYQAFNKLKEIEVDEYSIDSEIINLCQEFMEGTYIQKFHKLSASDIEKLARKIDTRISAYSYLGFVYVGEVAEEKVEHNNLDKGTQPQNTTTQSKPRLSEKVKIAVCGLLGALVGLVIGATVGSLLGGYGAIPGGFLGLVKGFTVGSAIAVGGCTLGAAMGTGLGFFKTKPKTVVPMPTAAPVVESDSAAEEKPEAQQTDAPSEIITISTDTAVSDLVSKAKDELITALKEEVRARGKKNNK